MLYVEISVRHIIKGNDGDYDEIKCYEETVENIEEYNGLVKGLMLCNSKLSDYNTDRVVSVRLNLPILC